MAIVSILLFLTGIACGICSGLSGLTHGTNPSTITYLDNLSISSFVLSFLFLMMDSYGRK